MKPFRLSLMLLAILLLVTSVSARPIQQSDGLFFAETGKWVRGDFLAFYQAAPSPDRLFGYPISDAIPDPLRPGMQVQYFVKARMDYDPLKPAGHRVSLGNLGQIVRDDSRPGEQLDFSTNTNMCRAFSGGRLVCYAFLQYYDRYNGPVYFGKPISDTEIFDGRLVQYFERARMEWRPERPAGQRVALTDLGLLDYSIRIGTKGPNIAEKPLDLTVHAFVKSSVLAAGQEQEVFVVVEDNNAQPVPDVSAIITITYPGGATENYRPEAMTNSEGFTSKQFIVKDVKPNQVVNVTVTVQLPGGEKTTSHTWFRIWW